MLDIEIVTHCYAEVLPQYAQHLKWQIASLVNYPPQCSVLLTVCYTASDSATKKIISAAQSFLPAGLVVSSCVLDKAHLFRRAIGRNIRAKTSGATRLWFTDVDYCFGPGCLDAVIELVHVDSGLSMPATIKINVDHATGDVAILRERLTMMPYLRDSEFVERRQRIAIGGVQIVGRTLARQIGYLDGTEWVQPVDESLGFRSCRCDVQWRRHNKLHATRLPIPNCYRLRHSSDGRDYDGQGIFQGKDVW